MSIPLFTDHLFNRKILATIIPALALAGTAHAQDFALEEIVVTASKRAESLQDVPIAVSALSGDEIAASGIDSQRMIGMTTPNVVVNTNANFVAPYVRGIGTQYANPGLEPSVASYFNDLYLARPSAGFGSFIDVARVEVLKGPQGTLYGRNTTGGAVRVITNDPTEEFEGKVFAGFGNYNKKTFGAVINGTIAENLMGRLVVQTEDRDGWVKNISGGPDIEDKDIEMYHGKLLYQPTDRLSIKLDADWIDKSDYQGMAFVPLFDGLPEQVGVAFGGVLPSDYDEFSGNTQNNREKSQFTAGGSQLRIDYEFETYTFSSITGYRYNNFTGAADLDATSANVFNAHTVLDKTEDLSQEFQLVSDGSSALDWLVGLYYFKENAVDNFGFSGLGADLSPFGGPFGSKGDIGVESIGPYGQVSYDITDQWEAMVGLRYTKEKKSAQNTFFGAVDIDSSYNVGYIPAAAFPTQYNDFESENVTPKAQITWRPEDGKMFYLSFSKGVKSGGFNMPQPSPLSIPVVEDEELTAWEFGWKTEFDRLRLNGAAYFYNLKDLQVQITDPAGGVTSVVNAGEAEIFGIEMDLTYLVTENLQIGAGLGWQDTEFTDMEQGPYNPSCTQAPTNSTCIAGGGLGLANILTDLSGNELPQAAEKSGYLRATYTQPLDDMGEIAFTLLSSYTGDYSYTPDNLYREDAKTLTNLNVHWTSADYIYEISGYVTNLTNEEYYMHNAPFTGTGGWRNPGDPRMYGVNFTLNF